MVSFGPSTQIKNSLKLHKLLYMIKPDSYFILKLFMNKNVKALSKILFSYKKTRSKFYFERELVLKSEAKQVLEVLEV